MLCYGKLANLASYPYMWTHLQGCWAAVGPVPALASVPPESASHGVVRTGRRRPRPPVKSHGMLE